MAPPTKTTNRIHFEDLDPLRFEDLCHGLVYGEYEWESLTHYGRSGSEGGIDIHGIEKGEGGQRHEWFIQCKRYKRIDPSEAEDAVEHAVETSKQIPNTFLLVVSCDVSKSTTDRFRSKAIKAGISLPLIWDATLLENKLYSDRPDLLLTYFGIDLHRNRGSREALIKKRLQLSEQMQKAFLDPTKRAIESGVWQPYNRFVCNNILIRSIDDETYPEINPVPDGQMIPHFKTEPFNFYYAGLEVILNIRLAILDADGRWDLLELRDEREKCEKYQTVNVWEIGRIPFDRIVTWNMDGDEFGYYPHIFCRFDAPDGTPYSEVAYYTVAGKGERETTYMMPLEANNRVKLSA